MASDEIARDVEAENKVYFKCCKKRAFNSMVCVSCGKVFHLSCATRDFAGEVEIIDKTRLKCCNKGDNLSPDTESMQVKIDLFQRLLLEMEGRNRLLEENKLLLEEKLNLLEGKRKDGPENRNIFSKKRKQTEKEVILATLPNADYADATAPSHPSVLNSEKPTVENSTMTSQVDDPASVNVGNANVNKNGDRKLSQNRKVPISPRKSAKYQSKLLDPRPETVSLNAVASQEVTNTTEDDDEVFRAEDSKDLTKTPNMKEDGWQTVRRRRRGADAALRPPLIEGKKENVAEIQAAENREYTWLFLTGLATTTTTQQLQGYLSKNGIQYSICETIRAKHQRQYSSFKVGVPTNNMDLALDANLWPKGVRVNKFLNLKTLESQKRQNQALPKYRREIVN